MVGFWTWTGWDALVALGTLSLATVTGWLAWTTRTVARADLADLRAQWRPLLVPTQEPIFQPLYGHNAEATGRFQAIIPLVNSGRGPALYVRAVLEPGAIEPDTWSLGAISPNEIRQLVFSELGGLNLNYQLFLDYRDLGGRRYSTAIVIDRPGGDMQARFSDVKLFSNKSLTDLGDSVAQPGLSQLPDDSGE